MLTAYGLAGAVPPQAIPVTRLTSTAGLSQNTVSKVLQDREGYIWLATGDGLNRYDGYELVVHRHDPADPDSLADSYLRALAEDRDGMLWVGTASAGLDRFDPRTGRAVHFRNDPSRADSLPSDMDVRALELAGDGALWVGTSAGLARLIPGASRFERITLEDADRPPAVLSIQHGASGTVYVGTDRGAYAGVATDRRFTRLPVEAGLAAGTADLMVNAIHEDADGTVWLGTDSAGLVRLSRAGGRIEAMAHRRDSTSSAIFPDDEVTAILPGDQGRLWLGTWSNGLVDFDPRTGLSNVYRNSLADPHSMSSNTIISLLRDAAGMIWAGTYDRGVNRFPTDVPFEHYYRDPLRGPSLPDNAVWAFAPTGDGALVWTGTAAGLGLFSLDERRFIDFAPPVDADAALLRRDVRALALVGNDLWVGSWGGGLLRWNPTTGAFTRFRSRSGDPESLSNDRVRLILPGRDGALWIGTQGGLNRLDPATGRIRRFAHRPGDPASLPHDRIRSLHEDRHGTLWVGTSGGVSRLGPGDGFTTWTVRSSVPGTINDDDIRDMHEDADGVFWLATGHGLTRFDPVSGPVRTYDERDGFRNATLYGLLLDAEGQFWISTNSGLSRFDPKSGTVRNFTVVDGLQDNEFNFGAYRTLPDGAMLFGGINGFNLFRPDAATAPRPASASPALVVRTLSVLSADGGTRTHPGDGRAVELAHHDDQIIVRFAALHYDGPAATRYNTWLEGIDPSWSTSWNDTREVRYAGLPAGRYVFRARAVSGRGTPARNELAIPLVIPPAPWQTGWAYAGYALAALLTGGVLHVGRIRYLARDAARLRREVARRTSELAAHAGEITAKNAELRDLITSRSNLYSTLSHELRTPLTVVLSALQAIAAVPGGQAVSARSVEACLSSAHRLSRLVDQLLQLARTDRPLETQATAGPTDAAAVVRSLLPAFGVLAASRAILLTAELADGCYLDVPVETVESIVQNLASNALKYTPENGRVHMAVGRLDDTVALTVEDTGIGIAEEHHGAIFDRFFRIPRPPVEREAGVGLGLALVQELAARHGGRVVVGSQSGQGARFTVSFPLAAPPTTAAPSGSTGSAARTATEDHRPADTRAADGGISGSIVIIEDDAELAAWLPSLFEPDFTCTVASGAEAGLAAVRSAMPDAVLCDIILRPDINDRSGFDVALAIRDDLMTSHIPIILLTALGDGDSRLAGLRREVDDYIAKPFDNEELGVRVRNLILNRRRTREHVRRTLTGTTAVPTTLNQGPLGGALPFGLTPDEASLRFLAELERHVTIGIDDDEAALPAIAAKFKIGERQLQRRIKDTCGMSFSQLRTSIRMREARDLLLTDKLVTEIAHALGYSSAAYFSHVFKRVHNVSPEEWRRSQKARKQFSGPSG